MRWVYWGFALLVVCAPVRIAVGQSPNAAPHATYAGFDHHHIYGASDGQGTFFGTTPSCCECPLSACDNAWDGYCQEKARWRAFWRRVGTGGKHGSHSTYTSWQPMPTPSQLPYQYHPMVRPLPEVTDEPQEDPLPPLPKPVAEKTTWRWYIPWWR